MSGSVEYDAPTVGGTATPNLTKIVGIGVALVALNIAFMLALSYTPVAPVALGLFSNFFVGIAVFVVTVGGGFWISNKGLDRDSLPLTGAGVALTQVGYALFGGAILSQVPTGLRVTALGIAAVITGFITAAITLVVYRTDHSFAGWQKYAGGLFLGGIGIGAVGAFAAPALVVVAGLLFFLGFVVDLTYEIWAVKENRYASDLRNAIGIYVAVMGVFIHVLQWVIRALAILEN